MSQAVRDLQRQSPSASNEDMSTDSNSAQEEQDNSPSNSSQIGKKRGRAAVDPDIYIAESDEKMEEMKIEIEKVNNEIEALEDEM